MSQRYDLIVRLQKLLAPPFVFRFLLVLEIRRTFVGAKREIRWEMGMTFALRALSLSLSLSFRLAISTLLTIWITNAFGETWNTHAGGTLNQNSNNIYREWCCKIRFATAKVSSDFEYVMKFCFSRFCPMGLAHLGSGFWKSFYSSGFKVGTLNGPELNI